MPVATSRTYLSSFLSSKVAGNFLTRRKIGQGLDSESAPKPRYGSGVTQVYPTLPVSIAAPASAGSLSRAMLPRLAAPGSSPGL